MLVEDYMCMVRLGKGQHGLGKKGNMLWQGKQVAWVMMHGRFFLLSSAVFCTGELQCCQTCSAHTCLLCRGAQVQQELVASHLLLEQHDVKPEPTLRQLIPGLPASLLQVNIGPT